MEKRKSGLDAVVEFGIDDSLLVRRITGRYIVHAHVAQLHEQLMLNVKTVRYVFCSVSCVVRAVV